MVHSKPSLPAALFTLYAEAVPDLSHLQASPDHCLGINLLVLHLECGVDV